MMGSISRSFIACLLLVGCAEGFQFSEAAVEELSQPPVVLPGKNAQPDAGAAPTGSSDSFGGEPCEMGTMSDCTCANGGMGQKVCMFDSESPTNGSFSECRNCSEPPSSAGSDPNPGDVMDTGGSGGSGSDASGGSGGTSSSGGSGGLSGGSGVMASTGGTGGSTTPTQNPPASSGGSATCNPPCTQLCFPIGVLPCCAAGGRCGCTWAPGAYCL